MAKIKDIVSSRTCKVNIGDYQSVDFFVSFKAEADEGEAPLVAHAQARRLADRAMLRDLVGHFKVRGKKITPAQICKQFGLNVDLKKD